MRHMTFARHSRRLCDARQGLAAYPRIRTDRPPLALRRIRSPCSQKWSDWAISPTAVAVSTDLQRLFAQSASRSLLRLALKVQQFQTPPPTPTAALLSCHDPVPYMFPSTNPSALPDSNPARGPQWRTATAAAEGFRTGNKAAATMQSSCNRSTAEPQARHACECIQTVGDGRRECSQPAPDALLFSAAIRSEHTSWTTRPSSSTCSPSHSSSSLVTR